MSANFKIPQTPPLKNRKKICTVFNYICFKNICNGLEMGVKDVLFPLLGILFVISFTVLLTSVHFPDSSLNLFRKFSAYIKLEIDLPNFSVHGAKHAVLSKGVLKTNTNKTALVN